MIALSGLKVRDDKNPNGDIEIQYTGLRPGEKLYEELLSDEENTEITAHTRILRSVEKHYPLAEILEVFNQIHELSATQPDIEWALTQLEYYVDGYVRGNEIQVN